MERDLPRRLGDFEILRELGRGGMGVVYEAQQLSLKRRVALKVLPQGLGLSENAVARFRREAEAAAKLHHSNIVPVYAIGEHEDTHYYAMECIDGPSLDVVIRHLIKDPSAGLSEPPGGESVRKSAGESNGEKEGSRAVWVGEDTLLQYLPVELASTNWAGLPTVETRKPSAPVPAEARAAPALPSTRLPSRRAYFNAVARAIAGVADALQYAHEHGVIHRDIKPSNLLLGPDGKLTVNDFGVARSLDEPGMTVSGEIVGSPRYMSPEQVTAGRVPVDTRTDIYSLGATLYELLTLKPIFQGTQRDQVLSQIIHKEPIPPRHVNRSVPVDVETICLKAMAKDPDRRYQTAREMAEDLRLFVDGFAVRARRIGPLKRAAKWVQRRPVVAGLSFALVLVILVAAVIVQRVQTSARAEMAQVVAQLESQAREVYEKRRQIVAVCDIRPGMRIGDVGAGTGLFTRLFAPLVGDEGRVYAVDISEGMVAHIEKTSRRNNLRNVEGVICTQVSVRLPSGSIDLAFICDTYRYFEEPEKTLASVHEALVPGGQVILIDSNQESPLHLDAVKAVVQAAGFKFVGEEAILDGSYFLRFEKV